MEIVLASASPRRQQLLEQIGCKFTVVISEVIEDNSIDMPPADLALAHAKAKALDVAAKCSRGAVVIGADTIVVLDDRVYGKPNDVDDARRMLIDLSGREHQVISGIAVVKNHEIWSDYVTTTVHIRRLSSDEIERYIATGEPMDKAGAYAIQGIGTLLVKGIRGCYTNVVGLPLTALSCIMEKAGVRLL